ncbi:MAG: hypothetical protein V7642_672 [Burkholderiales bacterium]|jgi:hypothetical protein
MSILGGALTHGAGLLGGMGAATVTEYGKKTLETEAILAAKEQYKIAQMRLAISTEFWSFIIEDAKK